eukprot:XP_016659249.1 PREDICTED: uncharacterized protein LOC107883553 [Acyrthosiphon pisum]
MVDILLGNEGAPSRRVPGLRGHLNYADDVGYTYVQNHQSYRQLRCLRYERGFTATASMSIFPENSPIVVYQPHNHHVGHDIEIGAFYDAMRRRALTEGTPARIILEEEAKRFPNAAIEVSREQALRAIRYVRRGVNPPTPDNLSAMGEIIVSPTWQSRLLYSVDDNEPFFHGNLEFIINEELIFGGLIFLNLYFSGFFNLDMKQIYL